MKNKHFTPNQYLALAVTFTKFEKRLRATALNVHGKEATEALVNVADVFEDMAIEMTAAGAGQ